MSGLGYLGMAYGPIQQPVPSGMKQALTTLWKMKHGTLTKKQSAPAAPIFAVNSALCPLWDGKTITNINTLFLKINIPVAYFPSPSDSH